MSEKAYFKYIGDRNQPPYEIALFNTYLMEINKTVVELTDPVQIAKAKGMSTLEEVSAKEYSKEPAEIVDHTPKPTRKKAKKAANVRKKAAKANRGSAVAQKPGDEEPIDTVANESAFEDDEEWEET